MIIDMEQPAKDWLVDIIDNFGTLMKNGSDPSVEIKSPGIAIEIRLMRAKNIFDRVDMQDNLTLIPIELLNQVIERLSLPIKEIREDGFSELMTELRGMGKHEII